MPLSLEFTEEGFRWGCDMKGLAHRGRMWRMGWAGGRRRSDGGRLAKCERQLLQSSSAKVIRAKPGQGVGSKEDQSVTLT